MAHHDFCICSDCYKIVDVTYASIEEKKKYELAELKQQFWKLKKEKKSLLARLQNIDDDLKNTQKKIEEEGEECEEDDECDCSECAGEEDEDDECDCSECAGEEDEDEEDVCKVCGECRCDCPIDGYNDGVCDVCGEIRCDHY